MVRLLTGILIPFLVCSCSFMLWADNYYYEKIRGIFFEEGSRKLVVIGEKYHYIFLVNYRLIEVLQNNKKKKLVPDFDDFKVTGDRITGKLTLREYKGNVLFYDEISGTRYLPKGLPEQLITLKEPFEVKVLDDYSAGKIVKNILLTPITVAADIGLVYIMIPSGVAIQGAAMLSPLFSEDD